MRDKKNMEQRTTYYATNLLSKETLRGTKYKDIKQVIIINILNYEMLGFDEYLSETVTVLDKHIEYEVLKGIKWHFIELPKFRKAHPNMDEKINQWIAFIDDYDKGAIEMAKEKNKTLEEAEIELYELTGDEATRRIAELHDKWEMDYNSDIADAREDGLAEGEKNEKIKIAKELLKLNVAIDKIAKATGLNESEIEKLRAEK